MDLHIIEVLRTSQNSQVLTEFLSKFFRNHKTFHSSQFTYTLAHMVSFHNNKITGEIHLYEGEYIIS